MIISTKYVKVDMTIHEFKEILEKSLLEEIIEAIISLNDQLEFGDQCFSNGVFTPPIDGISEGISFYPNDEEDFDDEIFDEEDFDDFDDYDDDFNDEENEDDENSKIERIYHSIRKILD